MNRERVLLVGLARSSRERELRAERLEELAQLTRTAGGEVVEMLLQIREQVDPGWYIGRGKVKEIRDYVQALAVDAVIFDDPLTPVQRRNLEEAMGVKVLDRTELILDIFALHAQSADAHIQVELAQLKYRLAHLTGRGRDLSRLGGGIGTRGPGEKKLEVDRRRILQRIHALQQKLARLERTKALHAQHRRGRVLQVVLVGYTGSGKSTLMRALTRADVRVSEELFSTLDTTTRVLYLPQVPRRVVCSDTVGFIRDLPPELVASFRATLGVIREADVILHVMDAADPLLEEKMQEVEGILESLRSPQARLLRVFNKIDIVLEPARLERLRERYSAQAVFVSALLGKGLEELRRALTDLLSASLEEVPS
ncbi:MAG: GTPase HflX [Candidatus Hydrothermae bacterium]|nr:GTPase HflX [Candidatus Hydrothermae bacterium]